MAESLAFNMDCMDAMKQFPDKYFDLAVVDPPYGIGVMAMNYVKSGAIRPHGHSAAKRRDYRKQSEWDIKPGKEYFDELLRISKKQIIFGGNYFTEYLPATKSFIVWDKRVYEAMTNDFADCEIAWMSEGMGVARVFRYVWNGMLQGDMQNKEDRVHPTQKPVALYAWIFKNYAKQGDKILDTHLGSGSSRIAAFDANLDFWGYEIDKTYFDLQEKRFQAHASQQNLFLMGDEYYSEL
jgi:site-specific DNA-methyltransferase (adenine-specific)